MTHFFLFTLLLSPLILAGGASEPLDTPQAVMREIREQGQALGIDDYKITRFIRVAKCENRPMDETLKNYMYDKYHTAGGIYMITDSTWKQFKCVGDKYNGRDNIKCAYKIYQKRGLRDWSESEHCWSSNKDLPVK